MSKYHIKIKRDCGPYGWSNRRDGFIVLKDGCNCMPGAVRFKTIEDAMLGIQAHMNVGGNSRLDWYKEMKRLESH